jgi:hypothetical protein
MRWKCFTEYVRKKEDEDTNIGALAPKAAAWKTHKGLFGSGPRYSFVYKLDTGVSNGRG